MQPKLLGAIGAVRREEWPFALLMFTYVFLVIATFWILKPLKKSLFIEHYDTGVAELYDLATDRGETNNLAGRQSARVADFRQLHALWLAEMEAQTNAPNPNFQSELWKNLYENVDVSRHIPTRTGAAQHERLQAWRREMNAVLPK